MSDQCFFYRFNMRVSTLLPLVVGLLGVPDAGAQEVAASVPEQPIQAEARRKAGRNQWEKEFWKQRALGSKPISSEVYDRALEQFRRLPKASSKPGTSQTSAKSPSSARP